MWDLEVTNRTSQNTVSTLYYQGEALSEERMMQGLRKLARIEKEETKNPRRIENDFKRILTMDSSLRVMDRITEVPCNPEEYLDENLLRERYKPSGRWSNAIGRVGGEWMV